MTWLRVNRVRRTRAFVVPGTLAAVHFLHLLEFYLESVPLRCRLVLREFVP